MKKFLYLVYYIKETPRTKFVSFLNHACKSVGKSRINIMADIVRSSFKYNISILDYFYFRFYEKDDQERQKWAGTGYMYEYQLKMNPKESRMVLEDKRVFLDKFKDFVVHHHVSLDQLEENNPEFQKVMKNPSGKIVLKDALGQCGFGIEIMETKAWSTDKLRGYMKSKGFNLLESFVQQANELNQLSPSGLNTIRIFTQLTTENQVILLGCRLRITINSQVDNMASGNMAAVIDPNTGIVTSHGVFSDITKTDCEIHPVTGIKIKDFQIPYWNETIEMITKAALLDTRNRSVGWDVAITNQGPELIEGNHNWCKLLWQLPVKKGLKHLIEPFNHV